MASDLYAGLIHIKDGHVCEIQDQNVAYERRNDMMDSVQNHCTRVWYMRPPVWVVGAVLAALLIFGVVEMMH